MPDEPKKNKINLILKTLGYGLISAVTGLALNLLINLSGLMQIFPVYAEKYTPVINSFNVYFGTVLFVIVAPLAEEAFFRLFLFNFLRKKMGFAPAMIVSSLIFAVYHMNMIQGIYAFLMGLLFCFFYNKDHRFAVPVTMHAFANAAAYFISL